VTEAPKISQEAQAKAAELGVDLNQVQGTGNEGEIVVPDVERAAGQAQGQGTQGQQQGQGTQVTLAPDFGAGEYVAANGERYISGVNKPVTNEELNNLERDDEGNLAYPLVEVKEGS
jgi:pyruvate/2-oxoglutarate dehydrogenase complex dihydrolipoamide acyltransferase (E2) component